ncbi:FAD-binding oxidoreductase [Paraliomyxa miuraensis]|uniref:FAD-binding oxidoreductase n=1 Tax=Paraliomyxa miuraensis TaxID=376150 RepID=UPI00225070D3|nr:FAD-linked oxidase C-terminal domain-containing protein [Paraliomyxa miuraensis]MCX4243939.1 FAD-binding protein [Paraliomyxa miuraensis]
MGQSEGQLGHQIEHGVDEGLERLERALGRAVVRDPHVLTGFVRDQAALAPAGVPAALVRARSEDDVIATLRLANAHGIPVVTRAAGTGLAGGANAIDGCIVLSVAAMDRIVGIDPLTRTAEVEPGVINGRLAAAAVEHGLFYAPDPASREISTIGGNIATNAGGSCCLKYGVTGDHVAALRAVLADGTVIRAGSITTKDVAGLDLKRLLVGSEGTLAVIVRATVRLLPVPPPASTLVAFFSSVREAAEAIVAMEARAALSLIEVMDRVTVGAVDAMTGMQLDTEAAAMVLVQSDAPNAAEVIATCERVCVDHHARDVVCSDDPEEGRMLLQARRMALPALERLGTTLLDDIAVPKPRLPEMFERAVAIGARHGLVIGTFGHAGDGNLHPTIVFDPRDEASTRAAHAAFDELVRAAVELGGTITGEHGVGTLKQRYVGWALGEAERALMQRIKRAFDPNGILNPGKGY